MERNYPLPPAVQMIIDLEKSKSRLASLPVSIRRDAMIDEINASLGLPTSQLLLLQQENVKLKEEIRDLMSAKDKSKDLLNIASERAKSYQDNQCDRVRCVFRK